MEKCWFCDKNPRDHDFIVLMRSGREWVSSTIYRYKHVDVDIPICQKCTSILNWKRKIRICYIVPMVVVIILGWIFGVKFENSPAVDERLVNIIMVGTFILPAILIPGAEIYIYLREKKKWPYDRRGTSRSSLSAHPKVSALKGLGFEILKSSKISKEENHKVKKSKFLSLKD